MKLTMIIPIYKGKSKLKVSSYRPVSVLRILSKILEKCMVNRLMKPLEKNESYMSLNMVSKRQAKITCFFWYSHKKCKSNGSRKFCFQCFSGLCQNIWWNGLPHSFNPNKAGLFEGSFFWRGQFEPTLYFKKN